MALVAVLALVVGGIVGFVVRGDAETPDFLVAGGGEPTARQEQMFEFADESFEVWRNGDGDAAAAMFVDSGVFTALGIDYRADDGSLARYADSTTWQSLELLYPVVANGDELIGFHRYGGSTYRNTMTFTPSGELLLVNITITS